MSLIIETGTGASTSESFCSVADADTYHSNLGNTAWASLITAAKEQALRKATNYLEQRYRQSWKGIRINATQALSWPRFGVYLEPFLNGAVSEYPYLMASNIVPTEVKNACAELALKSSTETLSPDLTRGVLREKVDVLEVEYDKYSPEYTRYTAIENMIKPLFANQSSANVGLVRI